MSRVPVSTVLLTGWLVVLCCLGCSAKREPVPQSNESWDQIYDFGSVFVSPEEHRHLQLQHTFEIRNPSSSVLRLKPEGTSCGCTQVLPFGAEVPVGGTGHVKMIMEAIGRTGVQKQTATLTSNATGHERITLAVTATVVPRLEAVEYGDRIARIPPGASKSITVHLIARQPLNEAVGCFETPKILETAGAIRLEGTTIPDRHEGGDTYSIISADATFSLTCPAALVDEQSDDVRHEIVRFQFGNATIDQSIEWLPQRAIRLQPEAPYLRRERDRPVSQSVLLTCDTPFSIVRVRPVDGLVSAVCVPASRAKSHELKLTAGPVREVARTQARRLLVRVETDNKRQPRVDVPVLLLDVH
jgi:Protein of unknown function (DUF1573)